MSPTEESKAYSPARTAGAGPKSGCLIPSHIIGTVGRMADKIRLPLLIPEEFDYPELIATIVRKRRERFSDRRAS